MKSELDPVSLILLMIESNFEQSIDFTTKQI